MTFDTVLRRRKNHGPITADRNQWTLHFLNLYWCHCPLLSLWLLHIFPCNLIMVIFGSSYPPSPSNMCTSRKSDQIYIYTALCTQFPSTAITVPSPPLPSYTHTHKHKYQTLMFLNAYHPKGSMSLYKWGNWDISEGDLNCPQSHSHWVIKKEISLSLLKVYLPFSISFAVVSTLLGKILLTFKSSSLKLTYFYYIGG